jgi:hypothetical protein
LYASRAGLWRHENGDSCATMTVMKALFADRQSSATAFDNLTLALAELGDYEIEEKKTCLHAVAGSGAFLGIHPRKDGLRLTLAMSRRLDSPRVVKSEQASARRFHNELDLHADSEVDDELKGWIKEAYERSTS